MLTPEELCAESATEAADRAAQAATAAGVCYDRFMAATYLAAASPHLVKLEAHCMRAWEYSVTALRTSARAGEVSVRGNTHTCSAAAEAAKACECASRAATYTAAAFAERKRLWGA